MKAKAKEEKESKARDAKEAKEGKAIDLKMKAKDEADALDK